jgi:hypothetical protein
MPKPTGGHIITPYAIHIQHEAVGFEIFPAMFCCYFSLIPLFSVFISSFLNRNFYYATIVSCEYIFFVHFTGAYSSELALNLRGDFETEVLNNVEAGRTMGILGDRLNACYIMKKT